ncbi:hypothetical protein D9M69_366520 [compost metagenome]
MVQRDIRAVSESDTFAQPKNHLQIELAANRFDVCELVGFMVFGATNHLPCQLRSRKNINRATHPVVPQQLAFSLSTLPAQGTLVRFVEDD